MIPLYSTLPILRRRLSSPYILTRLFPQARRAFCSTTDQPLTPFQQFAISPAWTTYQGVVLSIGWKSAFFFLVLGVGYSGLQFFHFDWTSRLVVGGGGFLLCSAMSIYRWVVYLKGYPWVPKFLVVFSGTQLHSLGFEVGRIFVGPIVMYRLRSYLISSPSTTDEANEVSEFKPEAKQHSL